MRYLPFRVVRACPFCDSSSVRRSHRQGLLETVLLRLILVRPYRCETCTRRHYNFVFADRTSEAPKK